MNRNLKFWGHLKILSVSKVFPTCRKRRFVLGENSSLHFLISYFYFPPLTFWEFSPNTCNLMSTNLRQKDYCSHYWEGSMIGSSALGGEGLGGCGPAENRALLGKPVKWAGWHLGIPSCLGRSLPETTSPRCDPRWNAETKSVCHTSFPFLFSYTLFWFLSPLVFTC